MARHYSEAEIKRALHQVEINGGNLAQTARQIGISDRTLSRWRQQYPSTSTTFPPENVVDPTISVDDVEALMRLKHKLMETVDTMADSIEPAIPEAPLTQRISGMIQLIDRVIRLGFEIATTYEVEDDGPDEIEGAETFERNDDETEA